MSLRRALEIEPNHARVLVNLGLTLGEMGEFDSATNAFERILAKDPTDKRAQAHLAIALQETGRRKEAEGIFDFERLIGPRRFDRIEGWPTVEDFNAALSSHILQHSTLMRDRPGKSTLKGSQTLEVLNDDNPATRTLRRLVDSAITDFIDGTLRPSGNPHVQHLPDRWRIEGWAVVLDSGGHQTPHIHPAAFCSGVYYIRIPEAVAAGGGDNPGCIKFGPNLPRAKGNRSQASFITRIIKPDEGMMVLFPSHFWHHTIPFESQQQRISVAFDAIAA